MRISKEKAAENRAALVSAASRLFRERGIDGVGVAEISKEAGLTHGALYAHFKSKEELTLAALAFGFEQTHARIAAQAPGARDDYAGGCPMAASASEIGRHDSALSHRYAEGYMGMVRALECHIARKAPGADALARAMVVVAAIIGGLAVARGAAKGNPAMSEQVLKATREMIDVLMLAGGAG